MESFNYRTEFLPRQLSIVVAVTVLKEVLEHRKASILLPDVRRQAQYLTQLRFLAQREYKLALVNLPIEIAVDSVKNSTQAHHRGKLSLNKYTRQA
jgi:hypothetical protein